MRKRREKVTVYVIARKSKKYLRLRWIDRAGVAHEQSAGTTRRRDAERKAKALEDQINAGEPIDEIGWAEFCERYFNARVTKQRPKSQAAWWTAKNKVDEVIKPATLQDVSEDALEDLAEHLRSLGYSQFSIATYLRTIGPAFTWAVKKKLLTKAPHLPIPERLGGNNTAARSRPVTDRELGKILRAVRHVRPHDARQWRRFILGLYHSGLRIEELVSLQWEETSDRCLVIRDDFPFLRFTVAGQKGARDELSPVTPEFWRLAVKSSPLQIGHVFPLPNNHGRQLSPGTAVKVIAAIGRKASVITDAKKEKFATSSDMGRRAFGTRMGSKLSTADLQKWMRHASVQTTLKFYHQPQAKELASRVWGDCDPMRDPADASGQGEENGNRNS